MVATKVFKINEFLSLKLIDNKTIIFVNGNEFLQCKHLLLFNPGMLMDRKILSIDDAAEFYNNVLDSNDITPQDLGITPEQEFQAHCSNLQAWAEQDYDTRLLHRSISFSLLFELWNCDALAQKRFKDEIINRFMNGSALTRKYLIDEHYWVFDQEMSEEERLWLIKETLCKKEWNALQKLLPFLKYEGEFHFGVYNLEIEDYHIIGLEIRIFEWSDEDFAPGFNYEEQRVFLKPYLSALNEIRKFEYIQELKLKYKNRDNSEVILPEWIGQFPRLRNLEIEAKIKKIPANILKLKNTKKVNIRLNLRKG